MSHFWWKEDHFMHIECYYLLHHQGKIEIYFWFLTKIEFDFVGLRGFFVCFSVPVLRGLVAQPSSFS